MGEDSIAIGCCGWPGGKTRYFAQFPIVELQTTFYDLPTPALATKWRAAAPPNFRFCIKAWQLITHTPASPTYRRLKIPVSATERDSFGAFRPTEQVWLAWQRTLEIARLVSGDVILFQCPASFTQSPENVRNFRDFFNRVDRGNHTLAWEPRGDWPGGLIADLCAEFRLIHCVDPFQGSDVSGGHIYWRMHGRDSYFYTYSDVELAWLKQRVIEELEAGRQPIYLFFNNTAMQSDAMRLQDLLGGIQIAHSEA